MRLSARNQFKGKIVDIQEGAVNGIVKIDIGGGGTIASEISVHNIDTVDIGVPVLSMHAPVEVVSKADVYMLYKAIRAVYGSKKPKLF